MEHLLRVFTLAGAFIAVSLGTVNANTIVVNTFADGIDPFGCTIRRAIENHNAKGQPNKQCEPGSGDDLISVKPEVMNLGDPLPPISGNLTIRRLDKCGNLRQAAYMTINPGATLTLTGIGIQANGSHNISIIDNNGGNLKIGSNWEDNCRFSNERTSNAPGFGGVLFNRNNGTVSIDGASFVNSAAKTAGGAIYIQSGSVTITDADSKIPSARPDVPSRFSDDSSNQGGAIYVNNGATLNIASNSFTFINNRAGSGGAAIYSLGGNVNIQRGIRKVLTEVSIAHNEAVTGAAIYSEGGTLSVDGIEINNNSTSGSGGAIVLSNVTTPCSISRSYFHHNLANVFGGAIYVTSSSILNVSASTFSLDRATQQGGSIYVDGSGTLNMINSTLRGRNKPEGVVVASGGAQIVSSTILNAKMGNQSGAIDLSNSILDGVICSPDSIVDRNFNLQTEDSRCPASIAATNAIIIETLLGDHGGSTPTIALAASSPAIGAIPIGDCVDQNNKPIETDQRGFTRPAPSHPGQCDIGAFEAGAKPAPGGIGGIPPDALP